MRRGGELRSAASSGTGCPGASRPVLAVCPLVWLGAVRCSPSPGAKRTKSTQIAAVMMRKVRTAEALKDGACCALTGAGVRLPIAGGAALAPDGCSPCTNHCTDIDLPARCQDKDFDRTSHWRRRSPVGRTGTTPKSRASPARRRWKRCSPVSNLVRNACQCVDHRAGPARGHPRVRNRHRRK